MGLTLLRFFIALTGVRPSPFPHCFILTAIALVTFLGLTPRAIKHAVSRDTLAT
ncbi:hypothetical protein [Pantoea stewartii]|uniref:hypothetical protein n=1 Tax=Pantoea stewartii TaxID=66269 RepID=UPI00197F3FF7|nr:hypothetical protein [Pantoea stewartii]